VPGNITSGNSFGTNYLIKGSGAKLIQTWQDVVAEFPPEIAAAILPPELKGEGKRKTTAVASTPTGLTEAEGSVWALLSAEDATHIDVLAEKSGLPVSELAGVLLGLEIRELVRQLPGRCFVRKL
jgi:DNA processing protein